MTVLIPDQQLNLTPMRESRNPVASAMQQPSALLKLYGFFIRMIQNKDILSQRIFQIEIAELLQILF
jgi:hypothetical protein